MPFTYRLDTAETGTTVTAVGQEQRVSFMLYFGEYRRIVVLINHKKQD
jgi:hypothetical protein